LPNGLTVATDENASSGNATVGVFVDAGSRHESAEKSGAANLFEQIAVQVNTNSTKTFGRSEINKMTRTIQSKK
jgi:processing peptidase subunit beta